MDTYAALKPIIPLADLGSAIMKVCKDRQRSTRTAYLYVCWARRYVVFHKCVHPSDLGPQDIVSFISHLTLNLKKSPSTQNQALQALRFLYEYVLRRPLPVDSMRSAKRPKSLPQMFSKTAIMEFIDQLEGVPRIVAILQFGSGLRLNEVCRLTAKDLLFESKKISVGDRYAPMPLCAIPYLRDYTKRNLYIFSDTELPLNPRLIQRAYSATKAKLSSRTLRQAFAISLLDQGANVREVQEIMGQRDIYSTLRYQQVSLHGPGSVKSPLDMLILSTPRAGQLGGPVENLRGF